MLETLDTNHDGKIDESDAEFANLRVWVDANGDGVSDADEVKTLADVGVQSISLTRTDITGADNGAEEPAWRAAIAVDTIKPIIKGRSPRGRRNPAQCS